MVPRQMRDTFRPVLPRFTYFISAIVLLLAACTSAPTPTPPAQAAPPPPAELSTIVIPIRASLEPLLPLIEKQVPSDFTKLDAYELDPSQRFGLKYKVVRDPIALNMQNAGLHASAHVHYAIEGCFKARSKWWPCISCGFREEMRDLTIELQTRFDWGADWTLHTKTLARPVDFGEHCKVTSLNIDITDWRLRPIIDEQLRLAAKAIDQSAPKLATIKPYAQEVWSSLQAPVQIAPKTWLVIEPVDVALTPIRGSGLNVTSAIALQARTRVILGNKPATSARPLPALRTSAMNDAIIRIPFDVELTYDEVSRLLTE